MYLVEQADDNQDGMVIAIVVYGRVIILYFAVVTSRNFKSQQSFRRKQRS